MPVTRHDVEAAREAAIACTRAAGRFLLDYCESHQEDIPCHPVDSFQQQAARDMRNLHILLNRCGENVTRAVLSQILFANSHRDYHALFDGYEFPTFHELACAAAEMTHVTLSLLAEDHPRGESDPEVLAELLRFELLAHKGRYADFRPDRVIASIEREAAATLRYLAEHNEHDLPNRALPGRAVPQPHPDPDPAILRVTSGSTISGASSRPGARLQ